MTILKFLIDKNPFDDWAHLRNIKPEVVADNAVNVCNAKTLVLKLQKIWLDMVLNMNTKIVGRESEKKMMEKVNS